MRRYLAYVWRFVGARLPGGAGQQQWPCPRCNPEIGVEVVECGEEGVWLCFAARLFHTTITQTALDRESLPLPKTTVVT